MPTSIKLAYKIVAVNKDGSMVSPISYLGLAVRYRMGRWAKARNWKYLFVYKTISDAKKIFKKIRGYSRAQRLVIVECETKNLRKAVSGGPVPEYRCTRLKPVSVIFKS